MDIGIVIDCLALERGGANASLHHVASGLSAAGHTVTVITFDADANDVPASAPYDVRVVDFDRPYPIERLDLMIPRVLKQQEDDFDVFHLFGPRYVPGGGRYRKNNQTPVVARLNSLSLFCFNISEMDGECHRTCNMWKRFAHYGGSTVKSAALLPLMKYADCRLAQFRHVDHLCAISPAVKQMYREVGVTDPPATVTPNIFDSEFEQSSETTDFGPESLHVLFTGRLIPGKGLDVLLDAATRVSESVQFHIVGDGSEFDNVSDRADDLTNVTCHGYVDHRELPAYYAGADIFIHPAVFPEPFGRTVLEALSAGLPVIVSDIGAPPWIAGDAGLSVTPGNAEDLTSAIETLLNDPEKREQMQSAAADEVDRFRTGQVIPSYVSVYESVV